MSQLKPSPNETATYTWTESNHAKWRDGLPTLTSHVLTVVSVWAGKRQTWRTFRQSLIKSYLSFNSEEYFGTREIFWAKLVNVCKLMTHDIKTKQWRWFFFRMVCKFYYRKYFFENNPIFSLFVLEYRESEGVNLELNQRGI